MLESTTKESESLVGERLRYAGKIVSTTGHEKPCGNLGRPLSKAKYSLATDSE